MDTPTDELNNLASIFRGKLDRYAEQYVRNIMPEARKFKRAIELFLACVQDSDEYLTWKEHIKGIISDCVEKYEVEEVIVRSMFNFNLDEELMRAFKRVWYRKTRKEER
jgi:hypothetical protein